MHIPLLVRGRGTHASPADRLLRFRKVLKSAQKTTFYRHSLSRAGLNTARSVRALSSVEEALPLLPISDASALPQPRRRRCVKPETLHNPLPGRLEITLASRAAKKRVQILAGSISALMALAGAIEVECALIVLTGVREGGLDGPDRDRLWSAFGLPIFEQHLGLDGQPAAHECEAHDGLHIVQGNAILEEHPESGLLLTSLTDLEQPTLRLRTGFSGRIQTTECECGSTVPRLVDFRMR